MAKKLALLEDIKGIDKELKDTSNAKKVNIKKIPLAPIKPSGKTDLEQGENKEQYITSPVEYADEYLWLLNPEDSGKITTNSNTVSIDFNNDFSGIATLKVKANGKDGDSEWSEELTIVVKEKPEPEVKTIKPREEKEKVVIKETKKKEINKKSLDNSNLTTMNVHQSISNAVDRLRIFSSDFMDKSNGKRLYIERMIVKEFEKEFGKKAAKELKEATGYPEYFE